MLVAEKSVPVRSGGEFQELKTGITVDVSKKNALLTFLLGESRDQLCDLVGESRDQLRAKNDVKGRVLLSWLVGCLDQCALKKKILVGAGLKSVLLSRLCTQTSVLAIHCPITDIGAGSTRVGVRVTEDEIPSMS